MKKLGLSVLLAVLAMPVMAVDGYKDLKFGMTPKEVKSKKICRFGGLEKDDNQLQMMSCSDLKFSGGTTSSMAIFIENKLVRFVIELKDENQLASVVNGLIEKYGQPSSPINEQMYIAVTTMPNQKADLGFDKDTVVIRLTSDSANNQSYLLMYNVNNYDELIEKSAAKANRDDL